MLAHRYERFIGRALSIFARGRTGYDIYTYLFEKQVTAREKVPVYFIPLENLLITVYARSEYDNTCDATGTPKSTNRTKGTCPM